MTNQESDLSMENPLQNKIVYIGAPKRMFDNPLLDTAYDYLFSLTQDIVDPRNMFASNQEWMEAFPDYLATCDAMVIVTNDYMVGKGVYLESQHFKDTKRPVYLFASFGKPRKYQLRKVSSLSIINDNDWTNYAIVRY